MRNETHLTTKKKRQLINDSLAYVDYVPRDDLTNMESLIQGGTIKNNLMWIFIGASESMPTRALGYIAATARIQQLLPIDHVQVISVAYVGSEVNKVNLEAVKMQFGWYISASRYLLSQINPDINGSFVFCEDTDSKSQKITDITPVVKNALHDVLSLREELFRRGRKQGGDLYTYTAAHVVCQDLPGLELRQIDGNPQEDTKNIVSVGICKRKYFIKLEKLYARKLTQMQRPHQCRFSHRTRQRHIFQVEAKNKCSMIALV